MTISDVITWTISGCIGAYWIGWLFGYGLYIFRRFILTAVN